MRFIKIIISIVFLVVFQLSAQETVKVPLTDPSKPGFLKVKILNGAIKVKGSNTKEVIIKASVREGNKYRSRKKKNRKDLQGLKQISNTGLDFSVKEYNNAIDVDSDRNGTTDFEIEVPKDFSLRLSTYNSGEIYVENVNGIMDVSNANGKITLKDISGAVSADALNKDITVNFLKVTPDTPMAFSSLNGDIDITFPKSLKADVRIKSERGDIFTDYDLKSKPVKSKTSKSERTGNGYKVKVEKWIEGEINGGGPEILFKNYNGDVIIRSN
ncbi:DUF4097 family beta strand repeat-containing protein [Tenacibaculum jejuense]|uniref:DUF4097 domain-containing protein n=1 Tax=Tenacibaculum jejuense TaxID=584609 RepID=A0A238U6W0_9FLAO|nr:DUF4097 family beta strand repeat-containing protein [Tenacibaculum jejuense]SNR14939.1 conserved protein of unknown function [Tenacibaculum jejuense]